MVRLSQILIAVYLRQSLKVTFFFSVMALVFRFPSNWEKNVLDMNLSKLGGVAIGTLITLLIKVGYQWINHCVSGWYCPHPMGRRSSVIWCCEAINWRARKAELELWITKTLYQLKQVDELETFTVKRQRSWLKASAVRRHLAIRLRRWRFER